MLNLEVETWLRFLAWMTLALLFSAFSAPRPSRLGNADRLEAAGRAD